MAAAGLRVWPGAGVGGEACEKGTAPPPRQFSHPEGLVLCPRPGSKKAEPRPAGTRCGGEAGRAQGKNRVAEEQSPPRGLAPGAGEGEHTTVCAGACVWWRGQPQPARTLLWAWPKLQP